jgi:hypothetical protein
MSPLTTAGALALLLGTGLAFPLLANAATTIEGKMNGIHCATEGDTCPLDRLDPHIALEPDFVVQQPDGQYYLIINLDRAVKARYVLDDVRVTGEVNPKYNAVNAQKLEVKKEGSYKTVWTLELQEREYSDLRQLGATRP